MITSIEGYEVNSNLTESEVFKFKQSPEAFRILSSSLYSNPHKAIIRELLCNSIDAVKAIGKDMSKVKIKFPNVVEKTLVIADEGIGMDNEEVRELYTTYFGTSKNKSNDYIGALGLGSKSPFSYTDHFQVETCKDGWQRNYLAFLNQDGFPQINLLNQNEKKETGTSISIPLKDSKDIAVFHSAFFDVVLGLGIPDIAQGNSLLLKIFENEMNCSISKNESNVKLLLEEITNINKGGLFVEFDSCFQKDEKEEVFKNSLKEEKTHQEKLIKNDIRLYLIRYIKSIYGQLVVNMGGILYPINETLLYKTEDKDSLYCKDFLDAVRGRGVLILKANIGDVSIAPSREDLHYNNHTINSLKKLIVEACSQEFFNLKEKYDEECWDYMIRNKVLQPFFPFLKNTHIEIWDKISKDYLKVEKEFQHVEELYQSYIEKNFSVKLKLYTKGVEDYKAIPKKTLDRERDKKDSKTNKLIMQLNDWQRQLALVISSLGIANDFSPFSTYTKGMAVTLTPSRIENVGFYPAESTEVNRASFIILKNLSYPLWEASGRRDFYLPLFLNQKDFELFNKLTKSGRVLRPVSIARKFGWMISYENRSIWVPYLDHLFKKNNFSFNFMKMNATEWKLFIDRYLFIPINQDTYKKIPELDAVFDLYLAPSLSEVKIISVKKEKEKAVKVEKQPVDRNKRLFNYRKPNNFQQSYSSDSLRPKLTKFLKNLPSEAKNIYKSYPTDECNITYQELVDFSKDEKIKIGVYITDPGGRKYSWDKSIFDEKGYYKKYRLPFYNDFSKHQLLVHCPDSLFKDKIIVSVDWDTFMEFELFNDIQFQPIEALLKDELIDYIQNMPKESLLLKKAYSIPFKIDVVYDKLKVLDDQYSSTFLHQLVLQKWFLSMMDLDVQKFLDLKEIVAAVYPKKELPGWEEFDSLIEGKKNIHEYINNSSDNQLKTTRDIFFQLHKRYPLAMLFSAFYWGNVDKDLCEGNDFLQEVRKFSKHENYADREVTAIALYIKQMDDHKGEDVFKLT